MPASGQISIANALFSKTQQRVLGLLFSHPSRTFYTKEVIRHSGMGTGTVTRELSKLVQSGLVSMNPKGNQHHYQANPDSPIFEELCGLASKTFGITDVVASALESLTSRIHFACIYGSIAKGTASSSSDVDLLVISDDIGFMELQKKLQPAEQSLQRTISITLLSLDEYNKKPRSSFMKRLLAQPKLMIKDW